MDFHRIDKENAPNARTNMIDLISFFMWILLFFKIIKYKPYRISTKY